MCVGGNITVLKSVLTMPLMSECGVVNRRVTEVSVFRKRF